MNFIKKPAPPQGDGSMEVWMRQFEAWVSQFELTSVVGMRKIANPYGGYSLVVEPGGPGGSSQGMIHRGEWDSGTSYDAQNIVTRGSLGTYWALSAPPAGTTPESGSPYWAVWTYPVPGVWG